MRFATKIVAGIAALAVPLGLGLTAGAVDAQAPNAASGEAFGTFVDALGTSQDKTPHALLQGDAVMDEASLPSASVPSVVEAENLFATTTGAGDDHEASAESSSTLENVNVLDGVVTADGVVAIASSWLDHGSAGSDADGSSFSNLVVNGQSIDADVAPNTRIGVPGVGTVVLNEQIREGDGTNSAGMTVNMIRVVLQDALTGATTGEIVVGSASSAVSR